MNKYLPLAIVAAVLFVAPVVAQDFELRLPSNPPRYLRQIPLGVITERQLLDGLGVPQNRIELDGEVRWQYERFFDDSGLRAAWTYVLVDGLVVDVIYNVTGCPFGKCANNGLSAREEQSR